MLRHWCSLLLLSWPLLANQRPLTHADYDRWRHIQNQQLSPDGRYLAYAVFPQQGDGEVVIKNLATGSEIRQPAGELPPPPRPDYANPQAEETPPTPPGINIRFSPDSTTAVFLTFAAHGEIEAARRARRKPDEMPKGDLVIVNLLSAAVARRPHVLSFALPSKTTGYVAYLQPADLVPETGKTPSAKESVTKQEDLTAVKIVKGILVLHDLRTAAERTFPGVNEYSLCKDNSLLVFAQSAPQASDEIKPEESGVFILRPATVDAPKPLLAGKGRYQKLTWNEDETRLAFLSDRDDPATVPAQFRLYTWVRQAATAESIVSNSSSGLPAGWMIADTATLALSKNGDAIFFGTRPAPAPHKPVIKTPADENVSVDLWAWNDDHIQPMQKVRASAERSRSYRAVYQVSDKQVIQLGEAAMPEVTPTEDGAYAAGGDDREYRRMQEYDDRYEDSYLLNARTGTKKLIAKKHLGRLSWSPDSRHAVFFDGKDWMLVTAPDATTRNLTANLPVPFGREVFDQPGRPPSEGPALWTRDGKTVLINDRFDIWRCSVADTTPVNVTAGAGRKSHLVFRIVRTEREDPSERYLDGTKPILLRAENEDTRDTGFYRTTLSASAAPIKLVMASKNFAPPVKARDADVYVTAASTFSEYSDLLVTDASFRNLRKVTDLGAQLTGLLWGTAELMHFESLDGVPLEGTLYRPANFDPKKKYPLIVYIYERLSQNVNNFVEPRPSNVINPSYYASNGYLVLEPDIAYRIGYPGQSALRCVLPAVQEIVNRGYVDEKAIGIQGHSWGGYQIAYMVTQTNRFRAAAPGAPVANMISAYDGIRWGPGVPRQFQYERTQSRIGGTPWEYPLRYIENSPIFMVDRIRTPLLMIHNDADDAVPWYQGIEYYLALRRLEKEVYLFSYNGEPHNLRRRPNQKDYTLRLQQFFDYYLKGSAKPDWMEHGIPFIEKPDSEAVNVDDQ